MQQYLKKKNILKNYRMHDTLKKALIQIKSKKNGSG